MNAIAMKFSDMAGSLMPVIEVPAGQEVIWSYLSRGKAFSCRDIAKLVGCATSRVEDYVLRLVRGGHAAEVGVAAGSGVKLYQLRHHPHILPQLNARGETDATYDLCDKVWRAAKMLRLFTLTELLAHLDKGVCRSAVRNYIREMNKAGYLIELPAVRECGEAQFKLVPAMSSGPLPPQPMRATFLFDRNRQAIANKTLGAEEVRL